MCVCRCARALCNSKSSVTVRVKRYTGKQHCCTGSRTITERSRFHSRSPAAVTVPTVIKPLMVSDDGGHPPFIFPPFSHPFCPRPVLSLHPPFLMLTFFISFYFLVPPLIPPIITPFFLHPLLFLFLFIFVCLFLVFIFRGTDCFFFKPTGKPRKKKKKRGEKIPAFYRSDLILGVPSFFFFPFICSDLFMWTSYKPQWKCQTHPCENRNKAPSSVVQPAPPQTRRQAFEDEKQFSRLFGSRQSQI